MFIEYPMTPFFRWFFWTRIASLFPMVKRGFRERSVADYRRVFELDPAIDTNKISAKMEQGMLTLTLPKSEQVKPRKITVSD